jgi:hypothetical protein
MKTSSSFLVLMAVAAVCTAEAQQDFLPDGPVSHQDSIKYTLLKPSDKPFELVKA